MATSADHPVVDRIRSLVQDYHSGNVRQAAVDLGLPQQTLARVLAGGNARGPRVDVVERVADFYGVDVTWLLMGQGEGPERVERAEAVRTLPGLRYLALVKRIAVADDVRDALLRLPIRTSIALYVRDSTPKLMAAVLDAVGHEYSAWTALVSGAYDAGGATAVARVVEQAERLVAEGFPPLVAPPTASLGGQRATAARSPVPRKGSRRRSR